MKPAKLITYKKIGDKELKLHVFEPAKETKKPMPAIVFFFGGGWNSGSPTQFYHQANYLAKHGILAISAEYRTKRDGVKPPECVKDGKAAVRYIRKNAKELGVDPNRIAAGGGSAGGHVAAATGTVKGYEHEDEDLSISSIPDAMVLFNPVYDNSKNGYGYDRVKDYWESFSPLHNINEKTPPTITFFGSKENLQKIPETAEAFRDKIRKLGKKSEIVIYEGQGHGFFNFGKDGHKWFIKTMTDAHKFLKDIGYLSTECDVEKYVADQKAEK